MRASTATARCGRPSTGLRSSSASSGRSSASRDEPVHECRRALPRPPAARRGSRRRAARPCPRATSSSRIDVGERRRAGTGRRRSARRERPRARRPRAARRPGPGRRRRAARRRRGSWAARCTGPPIRVRCLANLVGLGQIERDAARLGLVRARGGGLDDRRDSRARCGRCDCLVAVEATRRSATSGMP